MHRNTNRLDIYILLHASLFFFIFFFFQIVRFRFDSCLPVQFGHCEQVLPNVSGLHKVHGLNRQGDCRGNRITSLGNDENCTHNN